LIAERLLLLLFLFDVFDGHAKCNAQCNIAVLRVLLPLVGNLIKLLIELRLEVHVQSEESLVTLVDSLSKLCVFFLLMRIRLWCMPHWACEVPEVPEHHRLRLGTLFS